MNAVIDPDASGERRCCGQPMEWNGRHWQCRNPGHETR